MKFARIHFIICAVLFLSCSEKKKEHHSEAQAVETTYQGSPAFQTILDSADLKGTIVIHDLEENRIHSNDFEWAKIARLPASTFKIPNSMIALETGVVKNDSTLFRWKGEPRALKTWERDLTFHDAFHASCVPCYQDIARKIGAKRMNDYLSKLDYGEMMVDTKTIDHFWLQGDSKISPLQQIDFLKRFYRSELPLTERTEDLMKELMVIEKNAGYTLSGKTGWAVHGDNNNGWFVGYVENDENVFFFATNIEPLPDFDMEQFIAIRRKITMAAFRQYGIIE